MFTPKHNLRGGDVSSVLSTAYCPPPVWDSTMSDRISSRRCDKIWPKDQLGLGTIWAAFAALENEPMRTSTWPYHPYCYALLSVSLCLSRHYFAKLMFIHFPMESLKGETWHISLLVSSSSFESCIVLIISNLLTVAYIFHPATTCSSLKMLPLDWSLQ